MSNTLSNEIFSVLESNYPEPMHYKDITNVLLDNGFWAKAPKTPESTVSSALTNDINRNGEESSFQRVGAKGSGIYTINESLVSSTSDSSLTGKIKTFFSNFAFFVAATVAGSAIFIGAYMLLDKLGAF
jgi:hypothetical protein